MRKLAFALLLLVALAPTPAARADVSPDERQAVSDRMMMQMEQQYGAVNPVPPEQKAAQVFSSLLNYTHRRDVNFRLEVVQSRDINAYALPDGRVVMYSNLLNHLAGDPNALAFTEAHELSHIEYHHADKKIEEQVGSAAVLYVAVRKSNLLTQVAALGAHQMFASGYSRQLESEADRHGLELMTRAGYDPNGALVVFRMFEDMEAKGSRVFPNHPKASDRYANTIAWLNEQHIAIHEPNAAAGQPVYPGYQGSHAGGPQIAGSARLRFPTVNYGGLPASALQQGVYETSFEADLANDIIARVGNRIVVDSHLSSVARAQTGALVQSHSDGNRIVMAAMVPGTWQFRDWKPDFENQFLPFMQQGGYDAVGMAVKSNAAGTKQIILILGHSH